MSIANVIFLSKFRYSVRSYTILSRQNTRETKHKRVLTGSAGHNNTYERNSYLVHESREKNRKHLLTGVLKTLFVFIFLISSTRCCIQRIRRTSRERPTSIILRLIKTDFFLFFNRMYTNIFKFYFNVVFFRD